jgi:hypothetical protein
MDSKVGPVLALNGGLVAFLLAGHIRSVVAVVLVLTSLAFGGISLLSRRFLSGPNPDYLYSHYGGNELPQMQTAAIALYSDAMEFNTSRLAWKARFLLISALAVWLAIALLAIQVLGVAMI